MNFLGSEEFLCCTHGNILLHTAWVWLTMWHTQEFSYLYKPSQKIQSHDVFFWGMIFIPLPLNVCRCFQINPFCRDLK